MVCHPLVSVIVAVYKAEAYLHRCVDSLLAQTFKDFEILLVDDGSPDHSGEICDEYARKDDRIRVFHKENGGVSSARQCGIDNAKGEYTIHTDPDDWVEPKMLEELYKKAELENADMVICDYYINTVAIQRYIKQTPSAMDANTVLSELFQQLHGSCCNKLIKRVCYNGICFPKDINFCEDLIFCIQVLKRTPHISYLPKAFYHYKADTENSLVKKVDRDILGQDLHLYNYIASLLQGNVVIYKHFHESFSRIILWRAFQANILSSEEFKERYEGYKSQIFNNSQLTLLFKCLYYLSCKGYYRSMFGIYAFLKKLRNTYWDFRFKYGRSRSIFIELH